MTENTEPSQKPRWGDLEMLAKGIGLIATVGLGLGFLYDTTYFRTLDSRLARLLVISDHIETAIVTLPFVGIWGLAFLWPPYGPTLQRVGDSLTVRP
jgi:hypothetical protein